MLGFHHSAALGYQEAANFDGEAYEHREPYEEGFYSSDSSLTSPHSDGAFGVSEPDYHLYDAYVMLQYGDYGADLV